MAAGLVAAADAGFAKSKRPMPAARTTLQAVGPAKVLGLFSCSFLELKDELDEGRVEVGACEEILVIRVLRGGGAGLRASDSYLRPERLDGPRWVCGELDIARVRPRPLRGVNTPDRGHGPADGENANLASVSSVEPVYSLGGFGRPNQPRSKASPTLSGEEGFGGAGRSCGISGITAAWVLTGKGGVDSLGAQVAFLWTVVNM